MRKLRKPSFYMVLAFTLALALLLPGPGAYIKGQHDWIITLLIMAMYFGIGISMDISKVIAGIAKWREMLFAQVFHIGLAGAGFQRLFINAIQIVFLSEVGGHGNDFTTVGFNQPSENDRGVQSAGVGENYFLDFLGHEIFSTRLTRRLC